MNLGTGQKFFSKEDLLRYIKVERTLHDPKPSISCSRRPTENSDIKLRIPKPISGHSRRPSKNSDIKLKVPKPISDSGRRHSENSNIKVRVQIPYLILPHFFWLVWFNCSWFIAYSLWQMKMNILTGYLMAGLWTWKPERVVSILEVHTRYYMYLLSFFVYLFYYHMKRKNNSD